jgi:hypothetical protein
MTSPTPSPETAEAISEELLNETEIVATASAFVYGGRLLLSRDEVMLMAKCLVQFGNRLEKVAPAYERLYLDKGKDEAEIAALKARVMPEARRYATVEEIEALPDGTYWVALDRMRDTILPWNLFLRIGGDWVWHGDEVIEADADMIGAWIVGPLPLPGLPTEEGAK